MIRIAVYGTFREGGTLSGYMDFLRKNGRSSIIELPGVKMYVVGACPGAVLTGDKNDSIIVELVENDAFHSRDEKDILTFFDQIEGVDDGLYTRSSIEIDNNGPVVIYTYNLPIDKNISITDWIEWFENTSDKDKKEAVQCAGNSCIGIRTN